MDTSLTLINNDGYGAAELKKSYQGVTLSGFIIAITLHILVIVAYLLISYINKVNAKELPFNPNSKPIIVDIDIPPSVNEKDQPPLKQEDIAKPIKDLASLQPKPVKKIIADNVLLKTQNELDKIEGTTSSKGDSNVFVSNNNLNIDNNTIDRKIDKTIKKPDKQTYYQYEVEVQPVCINLAQVRGSIEYPKIAQDIGEEGKVTIKVLVDENGTVGKIGSLSGPDIFYDAVKEKAQNLVFTPGLQNNKAVKVWVTVPFSFKLKN